jgi:hypothetical protein
MVQPNTPATADKIKQPDTKAGVADIIRRQFVKARKALVQRGDEPPPAPKKKRSGETEGKHVPAADHGRPAARGRYAALSTAEKATDAVAAASIFMSEMLDWLHVWHHHDSPVTGGQGPDHSFTAAANHLSPNL